MECFPRSDWKVCDNSRADARIFDLDVPAEAADEIARGPQS
jgi:hypothetical protein